MPSERSLLARAADRVNVVAVALRSAPLVGSLIRRNLTVVTYTGRRSGRQFSLPVSYGRDGDVVTVRVAAPDAKNWWRNFLGEGGPITLDLDDAPRSGHAVAHRNDRGAVTVKVRLDS